MEDLKKVSSEQLYVFWKNFSIGLLVIMVMIGLSVLLPYYFSPIVALIAAAVLYTIVYNNKLTQKSNCMLVIFAIFFCAVAYSFIVIIVNILDIWQVLPFKLPKEFSFFSKPFLPTLLLDPICFVTFTIVYLRRKKMTICVNCKLSSGDYSGRSKLGSILSAESYLQLRNMIALFGILTVVVWSYYLFYFVDAELNGRDYYVLVWLNIIGFVFDELYFAFRYYNLYLDLKDNNEIITQEELQDMTSKTYLRFYVICNNHIFVNTQVVDTNRSSSRVLDTPFFTKRSVNGITLPEVSTLIKRMTGVNDGELRFFFGRKNPGMDRHSTLRYFYFLDGNFEDYPEMNVDGEWMDFELVKRIYSFHPEEMSSMMVSDITRMATIILTQKIFNEEGFRKMKLKSYQPSFNLKEVRKNNYDFQEDKWIRISMFNSDTKLYRFKRWWRGRKNNSREKSTQEWR
ncbi:MAG: hypothetical protein K2K81_06010 [Muribaculaceae bacterium]|nr:hypothetical protein [Muribaculaceae bacterium]